MEADAELVRRALARDQQAFAALYDRYADKLYDYARRQTGNAADAGDIVQDTFVLAIQRLHQLRDPSLVRPWLYAIARSEVHRRHRRVNRLQFTEPDEQAAMTAGGPTADEVVHQQDLRTLFTEAANGLDPSDREVLDLHLRHGMTGAEIAAALGIPERQVGVVVQRVRERLGRSIGVVLLARSPGCGELAALQRTEGTPLTVLSRKRLARHIEGCLTCSQQLSDRMRPETLLAAIPIALAPAFLRDGVLHRMADTAGLTEASPDAPGDSAANPTSSGNRTAGTRSTGRAARGELRTREGGRVWQQADGFPRLAAPTRRIALVAIGTAAVLLLFVALVVNSGDSARRIAAGSAPQGSQQPVVSAATSTTIGNPATTGGVTSVEGTVAATTTPAGTPTSTPGPVVTTLMVVPTTRPAATTPAKPAPPQTTTVVTTAVTTVVTTVVTTAAPTAPATTVAPPTTAPDTAPPAFQSASASPSALSSGDADFGSTCFDPSALTSVLSVAVSDSSGVAAVTVQFTVAGVPHSASLTNSGSVWQATIGPFPAAQVPVGLHQLNAQFTATDTVGNAGISNAAGIATVRGCTIIT